jgi:hypothetical protein
MLNLIVAVLVIILVLIWVLPMYKPESHVAYGATLAPTGMTDENIMYLGKVGNCPSACTAAMGCTGYTQVTDTEGGPDCYGFKNVSTTYPGINFESGKRITNYSSKLMQVAGMGAAGGNAPEPTEV